MKKTKIILSLLLIVVTRCFASAATHPPFWGSIEYINWWIQDAAISTPLVTQNNNPSAKGFIDEPGTRVIIGAGSNHDAFVFGNIGGGRVTMGTWLAESQYGIEASVFALAKQKQSFNASSASGQIPIINIPFYDVLNGSESGLLDGLPKTIAVNVSDTLQSLGMEVNGLYHLNVSSCFPLDLSMGLRYFNLNETFVLRDAVYHIPSLSNKILNLSDHFATRNNFYGIQTGARSKVSYHDFDVELMAKIALGLNAQSLAIRGETSLNQTVIQTVGLFAEPSNSGTFHQHPFALLPQLALKIRYHFNPEISSFISYDILYLSNVLRPGDQIDRRINKSQNIALGGTGVMTEPALPSVKFKTTSMWMQGLSVGIAF